MASPDESTRQAGETEQVSAADGSLESGSETATDRKDTDAVPASALEIEYRYFSFATRLPRPNTEQCPATTSLPPPPDLQPFIDPHLWPERTKNIMVALSCIATALSAYAAGTFSPAAERIMAAYGSSLTAVLAAGITMFCLGFGFAPMLLAPLSETNGRYPVFVVSGIVMVAAHLLTGLSTAYGVLVVARLLVGIGSSVFSTMVGGIIVDMWHMEGRNTPMAVFSGFVLVGTGIGPLISAIIIYRTTYPQNQTDVPTDDGLRAPWRWVFWHQALANAVLLVLLVVCFRESRGSVLLSRKAAAINRWYEQLEAAGHYGVWVGGPDGEVDLEELAGAPGSDADEEKALPAPAAGDRQVTPTLHRIRWLVKDDENRTTLLHMMAVSLYRPFHMLFTEPVVFFFSLWVSFSWGMLYLQFGSIFLVFENTYEWNVEKAGRAFIPLIVGAVLATPFGVAQDRIFSRLVPRLPPRIRAYLRPDVPEHRLYVACISSIFLPAGMFLFGFSSKITVHWIAPMIGLVMATFGIYAIYLSTFNYLADVYHRFASSALAAQSMCRNIFAAFFALITRPLFLNLGTPAASSLLGGIALVLTLVPWVLVLFGEKIRRRSKFAMALNEPA